MSDTDWKEVVKSVGSENIDLPKRFGEYVGKIILITDTHVVQLTNKRQFIAHEIKQLTNAVIIGKFVKSSQLLGKSFIFKYDQLQGNVTSLKNPSVNLLPTKQNSSIAVLPNSETQAAMKEADAIAASHKARSM